MNGFTQQLLEQRAIDKTRVEELEKALKEMMALHWKYKVNLDKEYQAAWDQAETAMRLGGKEDAKANQKKNSNVLA